MPSSIRFSFQNDIKLKLKQERKKVYKTSLKGRNNFSYIKHFV